MRFPVFNIGIRMFNIENCMFNIGICMFEVPLPTSEVPLPTSEVPPFTSTNLILLILFLNPFASQENYEKISLTIFNLRVSPLIKFVVEFSELI